MLSSDKPVKVVERFKRIMRKNIATDEIAFRKAYLRPVIDRVAVDDHAIRIIGDRRL